MIHSCIRSLRRFSLPWVILLGIFCFAWLLYFRQSQWLGVWPSASAMLQLGGMYAGPLYGTYTAYVVGREVKTKLEVFSVRPLGIRYFTLLARIFLGSCVSVAAAALCVWAVHIRLGISGWLWPSYIILLLIQLAACIGIGACIGALMPTWYGVVVTAAVCYMALTVPLGGDKSAISVIPGRSAYVQLVPQKIAWYGIIAAIIIFFSYALRIFSEEKEGWYSRRFALSAGAACLVSMALAWNVLSNSGELIIARKPPENAVCTQGKPQFCVWPENAFYLADYEEAAKRFHSLEKFGFAVPDRFLEYGLKGAEKQKNGGFRTGTGLGYFTYLDFSSHIIDENIKVCWPEEGTPKGTFDKLFIASQEIDEWMTITLNGGAPPSDMGSTSTIDINEIARVAQQDESSQRAWVNSRVELLRSSCG